VNVIRGTEDCRRKAGSEMSVAKNDMMGKIATIACKSMKAV
jgi:hypothetical protein